MILLTHLKLKLKSSAKSILIFSCLIGLESQAQMQTQTKSSSTTAPAASGVAQPSVAGSSALMVGRAVAPSDLPFWRKNPGLTRKIREDRAILVSVRAEDVPPVSSAGSKQIKFVMAGAGVVARSKDFCFRTSQQYSKLKEVSDHFKSVEFDSKAGRLYLVTEALGYEARMILRVAPVSEDWRSELQWEVVWGHFKGMKGYIGFEKVDSTHTEMSLNSLYQADDLPLPKILMGFALEVITQKVAEKMRTFIEAQPPSA